jgi:hypothetical protein
MDADEEHGKMQPSEITNAQRARIMVDFDGNNREQRRQGTGQLTD